MAGGKQSSRQKMINLMYLVFIAMMALNIDREVLRSFDNIDKSLVKTNNITKGNNDAFMVTIEGRAQSDPDYVATLDKAKKVRSITADVVKMIQELKDKLSENGSNELDENGEPNYAGLSNMEEVTKLFFVNDSKSTPEGDNLLAKLNEFNTYIKSLGPNFSNFVIDLSGKKAKGEEERSWLFKTFYGQPQVAAKTTLTKLQNDVLNAESEIIRSFLTTKMLEDIEINTFKGVISSPGILQTGKSIKTFVALGAFDNGISGTATVNGRIYPVVDGKATVDVPANAPGDYTLQGSMTFKDGKQRTQTVPLEPVTYKVVDEVISKQLPFEGVITADKMNVLYVGVQNPVSATVSGVQPSSITLSGPGLRSTGAGKGIVTPSTVGEITLTVSGKTSDGKSVSKPVKFRVKGLPKPEATIRTKSVLSMPASSLANQTVVAKMPDDFGFDLSVSVTGFTVKVPGKAAQTISGSNLGAASSVKGAKPGTTVTIFDIKTTSSVPLRQASNNIVIEVQ